MTYRIKPLAWQESRPAGHPDGGYWLAGTVFGMLVVEEQPGGSFRWRYCFDEYYDEGEHDCGGPDEGKRAAEQLYLSRLLPALEVM